jgi:hypothetical protein
MALVLDKNDDYLLDVAGAYLTDLNGGDAPVDGLDIPLLTAQNHGIGLSMGLTIGMG